MHLRRAVVLVVSLLAAFVISGCTPAQRAHFARWYAAGVAAAPTPVSEARCPDGPIKWEIQKVFGFAAPWAESVAWRESNCTSGAFNPSGSSGVFQLLMPLHTNLVREACGSVDVFDFRCNIRAAHLLYQRAGTGPWRL